MEDCDVIFFTFQARRVAQSPYGEPKKKVEKIKHPDKWFNASWDAFRFRHTDRQRSESFKCWQDSGDYGYFELKDAKAALRTTRKLNDEFEFSSKDHYGKVAQRVLYDFRIIQVTKEIEVIVLDE